MVELRHAPRWQLVAPHRPAGDAVRALAWLGPEEVEENLGAIEKRLSSRDLEELAATRAVMPAWLGLGLKQPKIKSVRVMMQRPCGPQP